MAEDWLIVPGNPVPAASGWLCPPGVTSVTAICWGGGGGSVGATSTSHSGGGVAGQTSIGTVAVVPGTRYAYKVGFGGTAGSATTGTAGAGATTWFNTITTVFANGGIEGIGTGTGSNVPVRVSSGTAYGNIAKYLGGSSGASPLGTPSAGGGGGGTSDIDLGNGNSGQPSVGTTGGLGGAALGRGGAGGRGGSYTSGIAAEDGGFPGGGAGGWSGTGGGPSTSGRAGGGGAILLIFDLLDAAAPTAPGQPALSNQAETSVTLTWAPSTDDIGVTGYKVYGGPTTLTLGNVTTTDVTGLTTGTPYSFTVTARDSSGKESSPSPARAYTPVDQTDPTAPGQPALSNQAETSVTLTWTASTDNVGVTGYKIYGGPTTLTLGNVLTGNVTGLVVGTPYSFTVTALDAANNESSPSPARSYTPVDTTPPVSPVIPPATPVTTPGSLAVTISWDAIPEAVDYEVFRRSLIAGPARFGAGDPESVGFTTEPTFTDTVPGPGSYAYSISAADAAGNWSDPSPEVTATVQPQVEPAEPTPPGVSGVGRDPIGDITLGRISDDPEDEFRRFDNS